MAVSTSSVFFQLAASLLQSALDFADDNTAAVDFKVGGTGRKYRVRGTFTVGESDGGSFGVADGFKLVLYLMALVQLAPGAEVPLTLEFEIKDKTVAFVGKIKRHALPGGGTVPAP
jgi:hypothetical protein